ncbi:hypothetical protein [Flavobacterium sp.]|uniref:hypothetical protein n=1 Tax=Flavobacterium sp. TaxID=239 RepID=UPI0025BC16C0|nr:hypothetical protein [Flavobacterium sp.]
MKIIKENTNLGALLFYLLLLIPFDYIFNGALISKKFEKPYSIVIFILLLILEMGYLIYFSYENIYRIEFNEQGIEIDYKLKKLKKKYSIRNVIKVGISNSQRNSMHNVNFYFDDGSKISMPSSDKDELKKVYRFFKDKGIKCKVVGLPAGRIPEDYNW